MVVQLKGPPQNSALQVPCARQGPFKRQREALAKLQSCFGICVAQPLAKFPRDTLADSNGNGTTWQCIWPLEVAIVLQTIEVFLLCHGGRARGTMQRWAKALHAAGRKAAGKKKGARGKLAGKRAGGKRAQEAKGAKGGGHRVASRGQPGGNGVGALVPGCRDSAGARIPPRAKKRGGISCNAQT